MEEDLDVIHACCICHRQAEARWCFCRDKNAVYCSSECQHGGWPVHKQVCSWKVAQIQHRMERNKLDVSPSNSQGKGQLNKLKNTIQISHHTPRNRTTTCADSTQVVNVYLPPQFQAPVQRQHPTSMEDDLCGIRKCCICNHWDEARWCFCRDKKAVYCSIDCQREGWEEHKKNCTWYEYKLTSRSQRFASIQNSETQHSAAQAIEDQLDRQPAPEELQKREDNATRFRNHLEQSANQIMQAVTVGSGHGSVGKLAVRGLLMAAMEVQQSHQHRLGQLHSVALQGTHVTHQKHLQG